MNNLKFNLWMLMMLITAAISAKEYHVSLTGNDTNDGSLAKPFKTISAAANVAMPGDVITVHSGVYREQITQIGRASCRERV